MITINSLLRKHKIKNILTLTGMMHNSGIVAYNTGLQKNKYMQIIHKTVQYK